MTMNLNTLSRIDAAIAELLAIRAIVACAIGAPAIGTAHMISWPNTDIRTKIEVVKSIRTLTNLGLKEAKEGIESMSPDRPFLLPGLYSDTDVQHLRDIGCVIEIREVPS